MMWCGPGKRKTLQIGDCPKIEKALYMWFLQARSNHPPISAEIFKAKAMEFYQKIAKKKMIFVVVLGGSSCFTCGFVLGEK